MGSISGGNSDLPTFKSMSKYCSLLIIPIGKSTISEYKFLTNPQRPKSFKRKQVLGVVKDALDADLITPKDLIRIAFKRETATIAKE